MAAPNWRAPTKAPAFYRNFSQTSGAIGEPGLGF